MGAEPSTDGMRGRPSREYRATVAFLASALFVLLLVLLYGGTVSGVPVIGAVTLAGPVLGAVVELVIAFGLAFGLRWARAAMTPALWILAISGVLSFLVSLTAGRLDLPIGPILAIWALRSPPRLTHSPAPGEAAGGVLVPILVAVLLIATAWPVIAPTATQSGGPLIAAASDLHLELQTTTPCPGGLGPVHTPPETIDVVLRWTWARAEPVRAGTDAVALSWATMAGEDVAGYYLDQPIEQQPGITEEDRSGLFAVYRIDLGTRGFEPGAVTIRLRRPNELGSGPGLVQVAANYAHHYGDMVGQTPTGLWKRVEVVNCDW